jgi:RND family efflux transporter MFP subunit
LRGQKFTGQVARTAASIDATTRSMQVEITLPNKAGTLLPGAFVQVALPLAASRSFSIPNNALVIRGDGVKVAVVDTRSRVHMTPVQLGRNYGEQVEVLDGLGAGQRLVLNPPDSLSEGDPVVFEAAPGGRPEVKKDAP